MTTTPTTPLSSESLSHFSRSVCSGASMDEDDSLKTALDAIAVVRNPGSKGSQQVRQVR